jgi:predicted RNA-binding protein YlqC (UPF0109 family)
MTDYANLVEYIVKNIVDHPDAVDIESVPGRGRSVTVEINLDPEDVGRVIGKGGRNIEAIRAVVKAAAIKDHERVNVEVNADDLPEAEADTEEGGEPGSYGLSNLQAEAPVETSEAAVEAPETTPATALEPPLGEGQEHAG